MAVPNPTNTKPPLDKHRIILENLGLLLSILIALATVFLAADRFQRLPEFTAKARQAEVLANFWLLTASALFGLVGNLLAFYECRLSAGLLLMAATAPGLLDLQLLPLTIPQLSTALLCFLIRSPQSAASSRRALLGNLAAGVAAVAVLGVAGVELFREAPGDKLLIDPADIHRRAQEEYDRMFKQPKPAQQESTAPFFPGSGPLPNPLIEDPS